MQTPPGQVTVYTDGGCSPNPGKGAWAAVVLQGDTQYKLQGTESKTTNNRMEVTAVIHALTSLPDGLDKVVIYTDSMYVCNAILNRSAWLNKKNLLNKDLILDLYLNLDRFKSIKPIWVKGHSGDKYNEQCNTMVADLLGL